MKIRKARIEDAAAIHKLVNLFAKKDVMLPRSLPEVYENIRDYMVCERGSRLVGCAALRVIWNDLAEIKSLAVAMRMQGKGVGRALVEECVKEARQLHLSRVFALTYKPAFFKKVGFAEIDRKELPHKIWSECVHCPKFPDCNETAVMRYL